MKRVRHHPALAWQNTPAFMRALTERDGPAARALRFAILTAARVGEVRGARWREIDLDAKMWIVPANRMKASGCTACLCRCPLYLCSWRCSY